MHRKMSPLELLRGAIVNTSEAESKSDLQTWQDYDNPAEFGIRSICLISSEAYLQVGTLFPVADTVAGAFVGMRTCSRLATEPGQRDGTKWTRREDVSTLIGSSSARAARAAE